MRFGRISVEVQSNFGRGKFRFGQGLVKVWLRFGQGMGLKFSQGLGLKFGFELSFEVQKGFCIGL